MQCPHLFVNDNVRICKRMVEEGIDGKVSDFDVQHYCQGNPVHCYYYRAQGEYTKAHEGLKGKVRQIFATT